MPFAGVWHCWKTPCSAFTSPCKVPMMPLCCAVFETSTCKLFPVRQDCKTRIFQTRSTLRKVQAYEMGVPKNVVGLLDNFAVCFRLLQPWRVPARTPKFRSTCSSTGALSEHPYKFLRVEGSTTRLGHFRTLIILWYHIALMHCRLPAFESESESSWQCLGISFQPSLVRSFWIVVMIFWKPSQTWWLGSRAWQILCLRLKLT